VLVRLHVQHELADGAFQPRQPALQHREPRARHPRRRLEIQQPHGLAQIGVILGRPVFARRPPRPADQHVSGLVLAVGHIVRRQVLLRRQQVAQVPGDPRRLLARRRDLALQALDLGLQPLGLGHVLLRHGGADQLRAFVAFRQRRLLGRLRRAQGRIQRQNPLDQPRRVLDAARRPAAHEGGGIVTDGADVVHGRSLGKEAML
jgi:hypothetical protein